MSGGVRGSQVLWSKEHLRAVGFAEIPVWTTDTSLGSSAFLVFCTFTS